MIATDHEACIKLWSQPHAHTINTDENRMRLPQDDLKVQGKAVHGLGHGLAHESIGRKH